MDEEKGYFAEERRLLEDLRSGTKYLLRRYALAIDELKEVTKERDRLRAELEEKKDKITSLEEELAFGHTSKGESESGAPAVLRLRNDLDRLILEVDDCITALKTGVRE